MYCRELDPILLPCTPVHTEAHTPQHGQPEMAHRHGLVVLRVGSSPVAMSLLGSWRGVAIGPLGLLLALPRLLQQLLHRLSLHPEEVRRAPAGVGSMLGLSSVVRAGRAWARGTPGSSSADGGSGDHQLLRGWRGRPVLSSSWASIAVKKSVWVSVLPLRQALCRVPRAAATASPLCHRTRKTPAPVPKFPQTRWPLGCPHTAACHHLPLRGPVQ